jgi:hypothetical protein
LPAPEWERGSKMVWETVQARGVEKWHDGTWSNSIESGVDVCYAKAYAGCPSISRIVKLMWQFQRYVCRVFILKLAFHHSHSVSPVEG